MTRRTNAKANSSSTSNEAGNAHESDQVGGTHYRTVTGEQHWDYTWARGFDQFQYNITKRLERWRLKGGLEDLYKCRQELDKYIALIEAGNDPFMPSEGYGPQ